MRSALYPGYPMDTPLAGRAALVTGAGMGIGQAITMPLFFASNALYPVDVMPQWLRWLSAVNPLSYEVNALRGLLIGTPTNGALDVAVLVVAAIAGIAVASVLLRRLVR